MSVRSDYPKSLAFLKRWNPQGPWVLTAIIPDPPKSGPKTFTDTFTAAEEPRILAWLKDQGDQKHHNIYFTVNPTSRAIQVKPSREHIAALSWLHVDLDPRVGEDIDAEQRRILALLKDPSAKGLPPPTLITFSGGGYQGFWRLKLPVLLDGTEAAYEEAKRWNKQIELLLGGDNCHNVDRIMRLPGTVNWPNKKKREKGRVPALAELIEWGDATYEIKQFTKAADVQGSAAPGFAGNSVKVSGNVRRIDSVDELPKGVSDKCKVVICQGIDPDEPNKFGSSRSEWLFFVCCELVRGGCDDDLIYSIITDSDFPISASVLDKGSGIESYAIRQIERAREEAEDPMLRELNDKHAVIGSIGSKGFCRILSEERDPVMGRTNVAYQNQSDFLLRYSNRTVDFVVGNGKVISKKAGQWWLDHPRRRYYDTVVFAPGKPTPGCYNLWKGFACDAKPGGCEKYLEHVQHNICSGDAEVFAYVLDWMARAVQRPAEPGGVAIVLQGEQGTGKGKFATHFGSLFGRHFVHVVDSSLIVGSFNSHLRECIVMFADEAVTTSDKRAESLLKSLVTEKTMMSHAKGVDAEPAPNYIHTIMASNNDWVVSAAAHERRYMVLKVSSHHRQDIAYFNAIEHEMDEGGREALLHMLLTRDISGFNVFAFPRTDALLNQQEYSLSPEEEWWHNKLEEGELIPGEGWPTHVHCSHLLYDFREEMRNYRTFHRTSATRLHKLLSSVTLKSVTKVQLDPEKPVSVVQVDGIRREVPRPYAYQMPSLDEARSAWAAQGRPAKWTQVGKAHAVYPEAGPSAEDKVWG